MVALVVAIFGLILGLPLGDPGLVCGPIAYFMGKSENRRIDASGGTLGGRSLAMTACILGIVATAARGTATDGAQPSANVGQSIILNGSGFTTMTQVVFVTFDPTGTVGSVAVSPDSVSQDGTSLTITVPFSVLSGPVSVRDFSTGLGGGSVALQIVSTVDSTTGDVTGPASSGAAG